MITDTTEMISPEVAYDMLLKNTHNRPINWAKVEEYAETMREGRWELHAQGIVLDPDGNVLTGQKRLWAVIYSTKTIPFRVSRGSPKTSARLLDRHTPQTARDLSARNTGERHSPTEASLARAVLAITGKLKPSVDELAAAIEANFRVFEYLLERTRGTKKTRAVLMVLAAMAKAKNRDALIPETENIARELEQALAPQTAEQCWGRGAGFVLAMKLADRSIQNRKVTK